MRATRAREPKRKIAAPLPTSMPTLGDHLGKRRSACLLSFQTYLARNYGNRTQSAQPDACVVSISSSKPHARAQTGAKNGRRVGKRSLAFQTAVDPQQCRALLRHEMLDERRTCDSADPVGSLIIGALDG